MPKDNIERALQKGAGAGASELQSVQYEGFGPGGVPLLINAVTDNNNRTASEIRHTFSKAGLELGAPGSAAWAFTRTETGYKPLTPIEITDEKADALEVFIDALEANDDVTEVFTGAQ
jgi:transcriptional/translational regulatory protein YebC/TACO1